MTEFLHVRRADGTLLPLKARRCSTFLCRLRGLTFRRPLATDEALLFMEVVESRIATAIHMFFVFFSIGVVWMSKDGVVVDKALARPFRPYYAPQKPAKYYLEGVPDLLTWVSIGERLTFEPVQESSTQMHVD